MRNNYFLKRIKTTFVLLTMLLLSVYGARAQTAVTSQTSCSNTFGCSYIVSAQNFNAYANNTSVLDKSGAMYFKEAFKNNAGGKDFKRIAPNVYCNYVYI